MNDGQDNTDPKAALKAARGITGQSEIIQSLTGQVQERDSKIRDLEGELGEFRTSYERTEGQLTEIRAELTQRNEIIQAGAEEIASKDLKYGELESKYKDLEADKNELEQTKTRLSGIIDQQEKETSQLENLLEEAARNIKEKDAELTQARENATILEEKSRRLSGENLIQDTKYQKALQEKAKLQERFDSQQRKYQNLQRLHGQLHKTKAEVDQLLATAGEDLSRLKENFKSKITEHQDLLESYEVLERDKKSVEVNLKLLGAELETVREEKDKLKQGLETDQRVMRENLEARTQLSNKLLTATTNYKELEGKYQLLEKERDGLKTKIGELEKAIAEASGQSTTDLALFKELTTWKQLAQGAYDEQKKLKDQGNKYRRNTIIAYVLAAAVTLGVVAKVAYDNLAKTDKPVAEEKK